LQTASKLKSGKHEAKIHYCQNNFSEIEFAVNNALGTIASKEQGAVDAVLYDLGLSSYELDESGRGFSFKNDEPLHMTFGQKDSYSFTASDIINSWSADQIETIIRGYGDEKFAGRIARRIVEAREVKQQLGGQGAAGRIESAHELAELIRGAYPSMLRFGRIHPATKTFQALRIAVNDELTALKDSLPQAIRLLKKGGRMAVISYHSLEDRIVKHMFKQFEDEGVASVLTKKPLVPEEDETRSNPRSRSAKLRLIEKL
jgi:16S rRNA (cytosine1402-N4)-methyltransferase